MTRVHRLLAVPILVVAWGCPHEASFLPEGTSVPLRAYLVGTWSCSEDSSAETASLLLGWQGASQYDLLFRPFVADGSKSPLHLAAIPRLVSGQEIWSIWDAEEDTERKFGFARVVESDRQHIVVQWLGNGEDFATAPTPPTPAALARLLVSPETKEEGTFRCVR